LQAFDDVFQTRSLGIEFLTRGSRFFSGAGSFLRDHFHPGNRSGDLLRLLVALAGWFTEAAGILN
jgi:hypothetical protein